LQNLVAGIRLRKIISELRRWIIVTILTSEQYESIKALLLTLERLNILKSADCRSDFIAENKDEWEICDNCVEPLSDCNCDDESLHGRYYAEYDDDTSFE
jgi:hypothetical protein